MVKKATICPSRVPFMREKVTKARFAALSINSMHMKTTIALRLNKTPAAPSENRMQER
jgi:hypothetical protein